MNPPIIKIELQGMRQTVVTALAKYADELEQQVQAEIDRQIETIDLTAYIRDEVNKCLRELVSVSLRKHISYQLSTEIAYSVEKLLAERLSKESN